MGQKVATELQENSFLNSKKDESKQAKSESNRRRSEIRRK